MAHRSFPSGAAILAAGILSACASRPAPALDEDECATRYPIVLVHGIAGVDAGPLPYWGGIPARLRAGGAIVFLAGNGAFDSIEDGASDLAVAIDDALARTGAEKVNLFAHSMGGLVARYLVSSLGRGGQVASLTTFNTPHRGSPIADYFLDGLPVPPREAAAAIDAFSRLFLRDRRSSSYEAIRQLTTASCAAFDEANPDDGRVYYRSYASSVGPRYRVRALRPLYRFIFAREGENDGLVSVSSARWGDFRGVIGEARGLSISHFDVDDMPLWPKDPSFEAPGFFASVAAELKALGY